MLSCCLNCAVLPKFEVSIDMPKFTHVKEDGFKGKVNAK